MAKEYLGDGIFTEDLEKEKKIVPESWYDYYDEDQVIEDLGEGLSEIELSDDKDIIPSYNEDFWLNNLLPSNEFMGETLLPFIDRQYNKLASLDASDLSNVASDISKIPVNTLASIPEMYSNILTLPYEGAKSLVSGDIIPSLEKLEAGDFSSFVTNPIEAMYDTSNLLNYSDTLSGTVADDFIEPFLGLWGTKKAHEYLMKAKKIPNWLQSTMKAYTPYLSRDLTKAIPNTSTAVATYTAPTLKQRVLNAAKWFGKSPMLRSMTQYGLGSGLLSTWMAPAAVAMTPSSGAGQSELDWERENMANINSMINAGGAAGGPIPDYYQDPIIQTAKRNEDPGPRNNYQGL